MPLVKGLLASIVNYRLGYAPTQPYAWRWTTPVTFVVFLVATIILALINVPLSAYTIVTEATYTPNASLPTLPLNGLVPSILQESSYSGSFSPQTLTTGHIMRPNGSIYSYLITGAYDGFDTSHPVSSFSYYNNPLSDSCDITNMTIYANEEIQASAQITCWTPTVYILSFKFDIDSASSSSSTDPHDIRVTNLVMLYADLWSSWSAWRLAANGTGPRVLVPHGSAQSRLRSGNLTAFETTVRPCCDCHGSGDATWNTEVFSLDYPPCSEAPASFLALDSTVFLQLPSASLFAIATWNNPDFFAADELDGTSFAGLNTLLHNLFQALYHTIRLDLGVSQPNQIYTSAEMYNQSISTVYIPGVFSESAPNASACANTSRRDSSDLAVLWTAEQQDVVRVPIMSYIRTVPRLKPLGAAITSVFVSTFAMVSVLWQVFSFIAAALSDKGNDKKEVESLRATVEQMRRAALSDKGNDNKEVESLRETVEQMRQALHKHGLIITDEESEDMDKTYLNA
ncbi:hypothetical protein B0H13DRAFT_2679343 [Mycena leptocephala]|nr:hypothetical protein B0H13DRAFT_2679343 [Mycena leptocephala]